MENYIFNYSAIILYFACAALLFFHIKQPVDSTTGLSKKHIVLIGLGGLCLHSLALYNGMITPLGINLGFYNAIVLVSAFITLFILIAVWRYPVEILAIMLLPVAALTLLLNTNSDTGHLLPQQSSKALIFHILTSIIAYSILALAALQAIFLSIQNKFLHAHQPGGIIKLMPPLRNDPPLEYINFFKFINSDLDIMVAEFRQP